MTEHSHHDNHHKVFAKALDKIAQAPDKSRRRRAAGTACQVLSDHMRCCHGWRRQGPPLSLADLNKIHNDFA